LLITGVEAKALIASSATVVETVLKRYDSFSIDDMCRQLIPLCDYSVAEKVLPNFQPRSLFLEFVLVASCAVMLIT